MNSPRADNRSGDMCFTIAGVMALLFYAMLAIYHAMHNMPYHILWTCHSACLFVAAGMLLRSPRLNGIGLLWLCFGLPMWIINVCSGDPLIILSVPTHIGGLLVALWGAWQLGMKRFTWVWAALLLVALMYLSRYTTPAFANVNLSHAIWRGSEKYFTSHMQYLVFVLLCALVSFNVVEYISRKLFNRNKINYTQHPAE